MLLEQDEAILNGVFKEEPQYFDVAMTVYFVNKVCSRLKSAIILAGLLLSCAHVLAGDAATLLSITVPGNTAVLPRTVFSQTWTFTNNGTTTWSATYSGYTLNMLTNNDSLAASPMVNKTYFSLPSSELNGGQAVPPGGKGSYTMTFVAPEVPGSYTDTFQLNSASGVFFGPQVVVQITVTKAGSTNQYDRARAISYANDYAGFVNSDGYFWTNGSSYGTFTPGSPAPTSGLGDDCAHFVSCCIGSEPHLRGGGLPIPSRATPTYGEPGAARLVNNVLIGPGYAVEVFSLTNMEPGDVVGWNWEGDTNIADLDHVTIYLGNGLLGSHSSSALDVSANTWYQGSESLAVRHLVHILDAPTMFSRHAGTNYIMSWGTNWAGYKLYSSSNLSTWTTVVKSPVVRGVTNVLTNAMSSGATFYRLTLPGN
ncbi:MAG TPA: NBR1-Ig-like domain-containing protein [Candidatus Sulfotelmatobacter sp.]|nr:NBR1-Ig-like domain-containing protein [Candidatus Sulfotelmatobacter sp.]